MCVRILAGFLCFPHLVLFAVVCLLLLLLLFRVQSPEELYDAGIYVSDLSMHDCSRDMILAGSQKDPELKIALSQVRQHLVRVMHG